nr:DUF6732 family protein [uncultured Roseibium sp.]
MSHRTHLTGLLTVFLPSTAFAHGGHLGELAGHSHWIGVAAVAGAALVAGLVALKDRKKKDAEDTPEAETADDGTTEEAAR